MASTPQEALNAKFDNTRLLQEFSRREDTCDTLVKKQQASFDTVMKNKVELEVIDASVVIQEQLVDEHAKEGLDHERYIDIDESSKHSNPLP